MFRQSLRVLLERDDIDVAGEAADGREALRLARELRPDAAVLDLSMPVMNGLEVARELGRVAPGIRTILLTMHEEETYILEAMRTGVSGYVLKAQAAADVVEAIRQVARGAIYLSPGVSETVVRTYAGKTESPADRLSGRERQVLQLVAEGQTTKEIARVLGVSAKTAESHRTRIMKKLGIHNVAGLVRYAIRRGLLPP
jgi:DNA-binding NarL/FixJ family response regulator